MKILIHSQTSTVIPQKFENCYVISPCTLLRMCFIIHGEIKNWTMLAKGTQKTKNAIIPLDIEAWIFRYIKMNTVLFDPGVNSQKSSESILLNR